MWYSAYKGGRDVNRNEALTELNKRVKNRNLLKHMYAVEAVLRHLSRRLQADEEQWALAGLLHDIDYEDTAQNPERHSLIGAEILEGLGLDQEIVYAVKVHNPAHNLERRSLLDHALHIADPVTGLIVAAALIHPEKKLASIDTEFILNRFAEKQFARGANREQISLCENELGISLEEFIGIGLEAMREISGELGL